MSTLPFRKMHGLGNDFVVLDARARRIVLDAPKARALADRTRGIGCDSVIVMERAPKGVEADALMRIWNADGGEVEACGNAARCLARTMMDEMGDRRVRLATRTTVLICEDAGPGRVAVDMGAPRFDWMDIPLARPMDTRRLDFAPGEGLEAPGAVNVGNPHVVFFVSSTADAPVTRMGPKIERDPLFPARINVEFAEIVSPREIRLRVWERGVGETSACGTGACATAVAAHRRGLAGRRVAVHLPGGTLDIAWREADDHIVMTGDASVAFEGRVDPAELIAAGAGAGKAAAS